MMAGIEINSDCKRMQDTRMAEFESGRGADGAGQSLRHTVGTDISRNSSVIGLFRTFIKWAVAKFGLFFIYQPIFLKFAHNM